MYYKVLLLTTKVVPPTLLHNIPSRPFLHNTSPAQTLLHNTSLQHFPNNTSSLHSFTNTSLQHCTTNTSPQHLSTALQHNTFSTNTPSQRSFPTLLRNTPSHNTSLQHFSHNTFSTTTSLHSTTLLHNASWPLCHSWWMIFNWVALNTWTPHVWEPHLIHHRDHRGLIISWFDIEMLTYQPSRLGMLTDAPYLHSGAYHVPMLTSVNHKYFQTTSNFSEQIFHVRWRTFVLLSSGKTHCIGRAVRLALTMLWDMPLTYMNLTTCTGSSHKGLMHYFQSGHKVQSQAQSGFWQFRKWASLCPTMSTWNTRLCTPCFIRWKHFFIVSEDGKDAHQVDQGGQAHQDQAAHHGGTTGLPTTWFLSTFTIAISRALPPPAKKLREYIAENDAGEFLASTGRNCSLCRVLPGQLVRPIDCTSWIASTWSFLSIFLNLNRWLPLFLRPSPVAPGFAPGTTIDIHSWAANAEIATMVESESTNYPTNMARCMGMLASETTQTHVPGWKIWVCWGCKSHWGKQCWSWWPRRHLYQTLQWLGTYPQFWL